MFEKFSIFKDLWMFLKIRKKWWLLPIFIILGLFAIVIVIGESSVIAPIIYTLF